MLCRSSSGSSFERELKALQSLVGAKLPVQYPKRSRRSGRLEYVTYLRECKILALRVYSSVDFFLLEILGKWQSHIITCTSQRTKTLYILCTHRTRSSAGTAMCVRPIQVICHTIHVGRPRASWKISWHSQNMVLLSKLSCPVSCWIGTIYIVFLPSLPDTIHVPDDNWTCQNPAGVYHSTLTVHVYTVLKGLIELYWSCALRTKKISTSDATVAKGGIWKSSLMRRTIGYPDSRQFPPG